LKIKPLLAIALAAMALVGCNSGSSDDLAKERSPSATAPPVKSTGKPELKASFDKLHGVGEGDGLMKVPGK